MGTHGHELVESLQLLITLFNPITYAAEGLRYAMIPPLNGQAPITLAIGWILMALSASAITCLAVAIRLFYRRVIG
jgi:ABC-2 type transport system permease protein